jgi:hypothetical protein
MNAGPSFLIVTLLKVKILIINKATGPTESYKKTK